MKVLQLTKHYPPHHGGIETVTYDLTIGLNKNGVQCDVLCCNNSNKTVKEIKDGYFIERVASMGKLFSTSISPLMIKRLKQLAPNYDIIHVHFPDPLTALALFVAKPKSKIIVHWHSDIIRQKILMGFYKPLQNWILQAAAGIIATSNNYANHSSQLKSFLHKVSVVPIGISAGFSNSNVELEDEITKRYIGKKIIFALGRLVYYKGFEYLIEAAKFIDEDAFIIIGGTGPLFNKLTELVKMNNLQNKVAVLGYVPFEAINSYFKTCHIFCLPATEKSEAFGVVLLEAMRYGKPIITSNISQSGICWVNQNNETGFNIQPKEPQLLASAINSLLRDEDKYKLFSKNCFERFSSYFQSNQMVQATIAVYKKII